MPLIAHLIDKGEADSVCLGKAVQIRAHVSAIPSAFPDLMMVPGRIMHEMRRFVERFIRRPQSGVSATARLAR
jgi:hypothetical protein